MKKTLLLAVLFLTALLPSFAQNITNPRVDGSNDDNTTISKIETNKLYTIVTFDYTAGTENSWVQVDKEIFIRTVDGKHYNFLKAENIGIAPDKKSFAHAGDKLSFKIYFKKIPATAKTIDIIERDGVPEPGHSYFNYTNVSLTQKSLEKTKTVSFMLKSPPIKIDTAIAMNGFPDIMGAMNNMGPMFSNMAKSLMDAQIEYYKQPGKLTEIAKLNKQYFDALVKEGFTEDQALKILISDSLLPKSSGAK
jgi:hypothetical protein